MTKHKKTALPIIGWREQVSLPDFNIDLIKVKVDTGARSSSLHVKNQQIFKKETQDWIRFNICITQRKNDNNIIIEAPLLEYRKVRSSNGEVAIRPVIVTHISLLDITWLIELTLASRNDMGFRMLLGREAFKGRFLVDAAHSYYGKKHC